MSRPSHIVIEMEKTSETTPSFSQEMVTPREEEIPPDLPPSPEQFFTPTASPKHNGPMPYEASVVVPRRGLSYYGTPIKKLGEGTYGTVSMYKGQAGVVAIKMMRYNVYDLEGITSPALREVSILVRMSHPNVVNVLDVLMDTLESKIYVVMPMAKMDLKKFIDFGGIQHKSTKEETKRSIAYQIINGVNYCLSKGILNRDIKPQNILLYEDGMVKIADFGLARTAVCSYDSGITAPVFTLWYRPLEILLGGKYYDPADVWAVGCTLYELHVGSALFDGKDEDDMIKKISKEFGKLDELWPEVINLPNWSWKLAGGAATKSPKLAQIEDQEMRSIVHGMLIIKPSDRSRLQDVLRLNYFDSVRDRASEDTNTYSCTQILQERSQPPDSKFIEKQADLNLKMIAITMDWLVEVAKSFKLTKQSIFLAQILLNKFLAAKIIKRDKLQLYGCAALSVATKVVEVMSPELNDFVFVSDNLFSIEELDKASALLVEVLGFDLIHSTSTDFLNVMVETGNYSHDTKRLGYILLKVLTIEPKFYYRYTPEELALGCLFMACTYMGCTFKHTSHLTPQITDIVKEFVIYKPSTRLNFLPDELEKIRTKEDLTGIQTQIKEKSTLVL
jgi:serine/threonine protein kinase